ncbi:ribosomal large subunit pseudouridine synthase D [Agrilactobacillus composti DSM 18527 = JCM 14202]|uniref:Pseudouridine synthase n=1 Tax=Agrilactobacillus composti DSM 18527 = JCM 14202 TaxID=1423734 RepID=X0PH97_9LACO|nr:RluA family pseudouridine synthase [Agrilactobacillus composti]KRM36504.1 ribosomal large subunit pseudouridine synthase D [Agrilactobacillus composti DSM 18527 = JCM 14202]GAF41358.1 ribosomal large subunit pseudouridine synthase D [Agrilactobacillus composti DSM 18527 = JCM 14202]
MTDVLTYTVATDGDRIDKALIAAFPQFSRSKIQHWLKTDAITVNTKLVKPKYKVKAGDQIVIQIPQPTPLAAKAENIPLDIVYEDRDVLVVNKPQGMVVHPSAGHADHTLVNALLYHTDFEGINDQIRPGIVHRIDKDTSGLLMVAKNELAMKSLMAQLKAKTNDRVYLAIVHGVIQEDSGVINAPIGRDPKDRKKQAVVAGGRSAVTHFKVLERFEKSHFTYVQCILETGRTHQIRVHMRYIGHPIAGDPLYGPKKSLSGHGQFLHAAVLGFEQPRTGEHLRFEAPLPEIFQKTLDNLRQTH